MMTLTAILTVTLALIAICHARAARFESNHLFKASNLHPITEDNEGYDDKSFQFHTAQEEARLMRLKEEMLGFKHGMLAQATHLAGDVERRYQPSGYLGSRGKRFIPGLESLLLARYYQIAEKLKRQPHQGFHASRG
uniref:Corticotropin-releasing factor domain-containing protein n=1 Tax=Arion vulgaris TaxID=1028688 RepID=A0A0B6Z712_9EUPU